jgi:hypothetical protein
MSGLMPAGLMMLVACSDDEPPSDPADTTETDGSSDVDVDGGGGDVAPDVDAEVDVPPPPDCAAGERRCQANAAAVVEVCSEEGEWEADACASGDICFEGACQTPGVCDPLAVTSCTDCNRYVGCNAVGTATGEFDTPFDRACVVTDGVAALVPRVCVPGQGRCLDDTQLETCDACGLKYEFTVDCKENDETTLCDADACVSLCEFIRKTDSYVGCEYWAVDLDNAFLSQGGGQSLDADGQLFAVVVSNPTPDIDAEVTVSLFDREIFTTTVPSGELQILPMVEPGTEIPLTDIEGTSISMVGIRIESTVPIVAYQFNPLDNEQVYSNDASLLLPTSSLGTEYYVMSRRQTFDTLKTYLTVIAVQPGETAVSVTLPERTLDNPVVTLAGCDLSAGGRVNCVQGDANYMPPYTGGQTLEFTLPQYAVLNISTNRPGADLTGAFVESNRPVAVFGGSEASNAPNDDSCVYRTTQDDWVCEATRLTANPRSCEDANGAPTVELCRDYNTCCADHLEHQMLPLRAWGRRYMASRSAPRGDEADVWRVIASQNDTVVTLSGLPDTWFLRDLLPRFGEYTINAGEWVEFQAPVDFEINSTRPIMVGQFLAAEQAPYPDEIASTKPPHTDARTGDPAFMIVVPVEQFRTDYTFLAPNAFEFDYVTITATTDSEVLLDGEPIAAEEWNTFGSREFRAARQLIADGVHRLSCSEPCGLMVYGYDRYVSYGYPGGLDLREINRQ